MNDRDARAFYWKRNVRYVLTLLAVWFSVSYLCGIVFADALDTIRIPGTGFKLGFWFAQQGSIYVFVILIFVYARLMNALDRRCGLNEQDDASSFEI
jgi:putative solute:sodium symporter small subunit